ncbi:MAG: hypothetical protein CL917_03680 [Deltaproteobacteria bacterium]|nr:hypothetical protein [Deltaproteobacteria bacterium]
MEIGLTFLPGDGAVDIARVARAAENNGFSSLWVGDHLALPLDFEREHEASEIGDPYQLLANISSPLVTLARAAAVTKHLKIGTAICLPNLREPIALAKDVATLDSDCGGRFLFGIGGGWFREEMEIVGADFPRRGRQLTDSVAAMKKLWTEDDASHDGPYYQFSHIRMGPRPHQKPHPPILLAGASQRIYNRVVDWGDGWIPTVETVEEFRQSQKDFLEAAAKKERDPNEFIQVACGIENALRDRKELEAMREMGVDHLLIWLVERDESVLREIDDLTYLLRDFGESS